MISHVLTLKQLEALIWVADLGSFRQAAQHLNTTQPNISSRIAGLEKTLGVVLMQRDAGSVRLTEKGRDIVAAARRVMREAEQIVEISQRPDLVTNRLRLGVTELVACTWVHAYLRRIKAAYPALNVELTVDLSRNLDTELAANRLDLTVQNTPFSTPASGENPLGAFPYIWVANPQIAAHLSGRHTVRDLLPHSVLTHARHTSAYVELIDHAHKGGLTTTRIVSSSSLASCVQMAADGMGVTLLPKALVETHLDQERLVQINVDWTPTPLHFAARYQSERAAGYLVHAAQLAKAAVCDWEQTYSAHQ